jgi:hypothetical protein
MYGTIRRIKGMICYVLWDNPEVYTSGSMARLMGEVRLGEVSEELTLNDADFLEATDEAKEVKSSAESSGLSKSNKQASVENRPATREEVVEWREQDDPREDRDDSRLRPPPRWMTVPWSKPSIGP